ncbi:uncharacterized protein LOC128954580 [Oppia nitens]|uniref:uncharacterized protein LOC128954580 n=1 Tax=Oppia nitens TaxID=1686743 RepID=UPI0023DAF912|nr:uncharacterized protein LOC128954580 [Oppia nitens]
MKIYTKKKIMNNYYHYFLMLLSVNVIVLLSDPTMCTDEAVDENMDNEIDNLIADNDRMALPYRRLPESADGFRYEICKIFFQKELKIVDYLTHKYHYNQHLRVIAANITLTRMQLLNKFCELDINFVLSFFKSANNLLGKTREYTHYAFQAYQRAIQSETALSIPQIMCVSNNYYDKYTNSFNVSAFRQISAESLTALSNSWMPYLTTQLKLNSSLASSDCNSLNTTYDQKGYKYRVSKQMALFDVLDASLKKLN